MKSRSTAPCDFPIPGASSHDASTLPGSARESSRTAGRGIRSREISPGRGMSEAQRECAEVAVVARMLVTGLLALVLVLALVWWLNVGA